MGIGGKVLPSHRNVEHAPQKPKEGGVGSEYAEVPGKALEPFSPLGRVQGALKMVLLRPFKVLLIPCSHWKPPR